jgi:hypothetical protein
MKRAPEIRGTITKDPAFMQLESQKERRKRRKDF